MMLQYPEGETFMECMCDRPSKQPKALCRSELPADQRAPISRQNSRGGRHSDGRSSGE
jgi:hypothetical protein